MKNKKIQIEFESEHLPILINALETYARLQSGQVGVAMDTVYADRNLSWDEKNHIEGTIRYIAFPANPRKEYDGHGSFYDQYQNEYDENGNIIDESKEWGNKKNRPHLDHPNSSFGVGCKEMKTGTIAWEIKKVIDQYLHYERNDGYRKISDVSGDGIICSYSGVPKPVVIGFEPKKEFLIPKKYQEKVEALFQEKKYDDLWKVVDKAFTKKPLPKGNRSTVKKNTQNDKWYVSVEEPYML